MILKNSNSNSKGHGTNLHRDLKENICKKSENTMISLIPKKKNKFELALPLENLSVTHCFSRRRNSSQFQVQLSQSRAKNRSCCMRYNATGAGSACICRVPTHTDGLFHMHITSALSWILEPVVSRPYAKPPQMPWFCQLKCQLSVKVWVTTRYHGWRCTALWRPDLLRSKKKRTAQKRPSKNM